MLFCLLIMLGETVSCRGGTVYLNRFDSGAASLNGLTIVDESPGPPWSSVGVDAGQLRIDPVAIWNTYVMANTASFAAPYSPILKNNPSTVTWAFNVSNQDSGPYLNNGFFFCFGSYLPDPTGYGGFCYRLDGGGLVGNRMLLTRNGITIVDIPSAAGLGPLPSKGSFRITYEPSTDLWSVFGQVGLDYVDPTTVTNLLGSVVDTSFTGIPLSYIIFGGGNNGTDLFDNVSVSVGVVPEPSATGLLILATAMGVISRLGNRSARHIGSGELRLPLG